MGIFFVLIALVVILGLAFLSKNKEKERNKYDQADSGKFASSEAEFEDLNEKFLKNLQGKEVRRVVKTYNSFDKEQIRSLLDSCEILSYAEFENMNNLLPGLGIYGYSESYISVSIDDIPEALIVIKEYIEERRQEVKSPSLVEQNTGNLVTKALLTVDGFTGNLPELLGENET